MSCENIKEEEGRRRKTKEDVMGKKPFSEHLILGNHFWDHNWYDAWNGINANIYPYYIASSIRISNYPHQRFSQKSRGTPNKDTI